MTFKALFGVILMTFPHMLGAQNYIDYHKRLNAINALILKDNLSGALEELDTLAEEYNFIYARHALKALQCAIVAEDNERSGFWLKQCFSTGIPLWFYYSNGITAPYLKAQDSIGITILFEKGQRHYRNSINRDLRRMVDSLLDIDQSFTKKVNDGFWPLRGTVYNRKWKKNNIIQANVLETLIAKYGYPGERLIGLDEIPEDSLNREYYTRNGPVFMEHSVAIMFLHYFSDPRPGMNDIFQKELEKGNMEPTDFGQINDFMAKHGRGKYVPGNYYNCWFRDKDASHIEAIEKRREAAGLPGLDQQAALRKALSRQYGEKSRNTSISLH